MRFLPGKRISLVRIGAPGLIVLALSGNLCIGGGWRPTGPYGGAAEFVKISKSNPNVMITGTRRGMIFRSEDRGANWNRIASPAPPGCVLHALDIHPQEPDTWYAGFDCDVLTANAGLYETTNAGRTWTRPTPLAGTGVWAIAFSLSAKRVGVGTTSGVFWNAGDGWQRISPESNQDLRPVVALAFDPNDEDILFAGTTHLPWRTLDGGKNWTSIHSGMLDDSDVFSVSPDRGTKGLVYASACSGVYRSATSGDMWTRLRTPPGAFRAYLVTPDPHRPQVLYAATSLGFLRSNDDGATWTKLMRDIVHSVSFHPTVPKEIYVASLSSGILVSREGGDGFRPINHGFADRQFRSLAVSSSTLYVTAPSGADPALFRSADGGATWHSEPGWPKNLRHVVTNDGNPGTVFAASSSRVYASLDSGKIWTPLPALPGGRVVALKATRAGALAAGPTSLHRWTKAVPAWKPVRLPEPVSIHGLHAGTDGFVAVSGDKGLLLSGDGGVTWQVCTGISNHGAIHTVAGVSGENGFVLLGTADGLLRSDDACRSWTPVQNGLSGDTVSLVSVDPSRSLAFAVEHGRVFMSGDRGQNWKPLSDENRLGDFPLALHVVDGSPLRLFALFSGAGLMAQDIASAERQGVTTALSDKQGGSRQ